MPRRLAGAGLLLVALTLLSACQLSVDVTTKLDGHGGGIFTLGMHADSQLVGILRADDERGKELASIEQLYAGLAAAGWSVQRSEKDGLSLSASRSFKDSTEFDRVLNELASARKTPGANIGGAVLSLDFKTKRSFLRTRSEFSGVFDTTALAENREILAQLSNVFQMEIRTELPGTPSVRAGDASVSDDSVVWRPELGSRVVFAAQSSALRAGSLLVIIVPGLLLAGLIGWLLLGRKQPSRVEELLVPELRERAREVARPQPSLEGELLAIKPEQPVVIALEDVDGARDPSVTGP